MGIKSKSSIFEIIQEDRINTYKLKFADDIRQHVLELQREWEPEVRQFNPEASDSPYFLSPKLGKFISSVLYRKYKDEFERLTGRQLDEVDQKVVHILYKVVVWDTYQLIARNAKIASDFLQGIAKDKKYVNLRWICTGAGVAERSLISQLRKDGVKDIRGVTTDICGAAIIVAAINLELMNIDLQDEPLDVRIVFGLVPESLRDKPNTIVLQIDDAYESLDRERGHHKYDAFLADNALPYFPREVGKRLLSVGINILNTPGIVQALGLNRGMFVNIPLIIKLKQIFHKDIKAEYTRQIEEAESKRGRPFLHDYKHVYYKDNKGVITKVASYGAGDMFSWIKHYFSTLQIAKAFLLIKMINIGTGLSKWGKQILTNTNETFDDLEALLLEHKYEIIDSPGEKEDWEDNVMSSFSVTVSDKLSNTGI